MTVDEYWNEYLLEQYPRIKKIIKYQVRDEDQILDVLQDILICLLQSLKNRWPCVKRIQLDEVKKYTNAVIGNQIKEYLEGE